MDIQSLRAGFCGGGGNVITLAENGRKWQKTAENGRLQQIAAVKGRQLQSRDLQIVYNFKQRCRSSPLLSLALDSRL